MKVVINFYDQAGKKTKKVKTSGKKGGGKKNKKAVENAEQNQQPVCGGCGVSIMGPFPMTSEMMSKYPGLEAIIKSIESACNGDCEGCADQGATKTEEHQCNCQNGGECACGNKEHSCGECNNEEKMPENAAPADTGSGKYKTGDLVQFVYDGRTWDAIIADANDEWAEVVFLETLDEDRPMNSTDTNEGGFIASELCKWLNSEGISKFPKITQDQMVAYPDGIKLRIPTEKQIFGCNEYGEDQPNEKQFEPMKKRRNRVAFQKDSSADGGEAFNWYWVEDKRKNSSAGFCGCGHGGDANYGNASYAHGVRLRFRIVNH